MGSKATYQLEVLLGASASASFYRNLNGAAKNFNSLSSTARRVAGTITAAFAAVNIKSAIEGIVETYADYEQALANTSAIAGASAAEQLELAEAAKSAGRDTIYTAAESAEALGYMALAGWDVNESTTALMPVLELASATGAELQTTSDLVTDSMSALGIGVKDLNGYLDILVETNNDANTTAASLMEAMIKAGGASRALGVDLDDTVTALGILANNGKKGAEAGTALNAIFVRLAGNTTALKELDKLKIDLWNDDGTFIGFQESLEVIEGALSNLTDEQRTKSLKNIAGTNYYSQMEYLLDSVTQGVNAENSAWEELEEQVNSSSGALDRMYDTTTDTLEFAKARYESAIDASKVNIGETFSDSYKDTLNWMAEKIPEITNSLIEFAEVHEKDIAKAFDKAEDVMEGAWTVIQTGGTWIIKNKGTVVSALTAIATAIGTVKLIETGASLVNMFAALANPVGGVILAAGAIAGVAQAIHQAHEAAVQANLEEHFGSISLSMEELDQMARQIVGEESLQGVTSFLDALAASEDTLEGIVDVWSDLQKDSWKLNVGFIFNQDDSATYEANIDNYVKSVEQYASDKGYEVHLAASLLFGEGSKQDNESGTFFAEIEETLSAYGSELSSYITNAMEDGIIDVDEDAVVQEYLAKMSSITQAITEAESKAKLDSITLKYDATDMDSESFAMLQEDIASYTEEVAEGAKEARESAMTEFYARLELDDDYTQEDFDRDAQDAQEAYNKILGNAAMNGINYMLDAINSSYPELQDGMEKYESALQDILQKYSDESDVELTQQWEIDPQIVMKNMEDEAYTALKEALGDLDRENLQALLEQMLPTVQELAPMIQSYNEAGEKLPEEIQEFMNNWQLISDIANESPDAAVIDLTNLMVADGNFQSFIDQYGYEVDQAHATVKAKVDETFADGFDAQAELRVHFQTTYKGITSGTKILQNGTQESLSFLLNGNIASNAQGGIYDSPLLTTFAEEGPEAAIPLDGSNRAKGLLLEAADRLGMLDGPGRDQVMYDALATGANSTTTNNSSDITIHITNSPNVTISGNAAKEDIQNALSMSLDDLKSMIEEITANQKRVSFV